MAPPSRRDIITSNLGGVEDSGPSWISASSLKLKRGGPGVLTTRRVALDFCRMAETSFFFLRQTTLVFATFFSSSGFFFSSLCDQTVASVVDHPSHRKKIKRENYWIEKRGEKLSSRDSTSFSSLG